MKIKKLLAGVLAASLAATSLAVVNVSAEDTTKTYNLVGEEGKIKFTYEMSVNFRGGIAPYKGWVDEEGTEAEDYLFNKTGVISFSYAGDNGTLTIYHGDSTVTQDTIDREKAINDTYLSKVKTGNGMTIEVTGVDAKGNVVVSKAKTEVKDGKEKFTILKEGDWGKIVGEHDLDLIEMVKVRSMKLTEEFEVKTGQYIVGNGLGCIVCPGEGLTDAINQGEGWKLTSYWANVTGSKSSTGGRNVIVTVPYGFGGEKDTAHKIVINGGDLEYLDFGYNTLRWINDNIEQNKGATLRINFMTPAQSNALDLIGVGNTDSYITDTDINKGDWDVPVLTPGKDTTPGTVTEQDIAIAVNLKNTSKLQAATNINTTDKNNMYADFDWDKLVQNSVSTVAGNVDSIHFRVLDTANVKNNLKPTGKNFVGIKSIQIIIPDQATIPGGNTAWEDEVVTVNDENSGVGAELTNKALTGNGGTIIKATGTLTTNKLTYEVKLLDKDGKAVQPAGDVTLTLPIPQDMQGRTINKVTHYKGDGSSEQLDVINKDTYLTDKFVKVVTSSFSGFEIEFDDTTATEAPATEAPTTEAPATEAPATEAPAETTAAAGDVNNGGNDKNIPTGFAIALVPAAIAAAGVVVAKKRK